MTEINKEENNMADFNLELPFKVIPEFKGTFGELQSFLKIIEIINITLKNEAKTSPIDFIVNVKLKSTVRTAISTQECKTFNNLKYTLTSRYKTKKKHSSNTK